MSQLVSPSTTPTRSALPAQMAAYRSIREEVERGILPLATSLDGGWFDFQASLHGLTLRRGGYVMLGGAPPRLGQVTDLRVDSQAVSGPFAAEVGGSLAVRLARGRGRVLAAGAEAFHDAPVRPAAPQEVATWLEGEDRRGRAGLTVGEYLLAPGVPATLDSGGFNRHTFMCGQSGSGKTYSLGVLLERILAETRLRVVVLDPNSDYVGLGRVRAAADARQAGRYGHVLREVAVWRNDASAEHRLRLRFADLDSATQAAVLGLDPIRDRDEYAVLTDLLRLQADGEPLVADVEQLLHAETSGARELGMRARNLGVMDWSLWSPQGPSLVDELRVPTRRCTVVDLGSLDSVHEQRVVASAVLSTLWQTRASRTPCLLVVDEAHNVCAADAADELGRLSAAAAVQIAAEGRKYGLYLLVSTQRPHKIPENVVSQCDNLLLMRMNSAGDLADLSRLFSFVPEGLLEGATSFRMGQALVAGKLLPQPAYVQMGERVTEEGGSDLPTTWATSPEDTM